MNLLFLDSIEKDVYGGMEEWIRLVAAGLVTRGHRVKVAGRTDSRFLDRLQRETDNVQLMPLEISGDFHPMTIAKLTRVLTEDKIDIVIVNFNKDVRLGGLAAKLEGDARVVWSVGLDITRDSWVHRFLTPKLIDGVIVPSESLKRQITRHGYISPDIVKVIPIGIPDTTMVHTEHTRAELLEKYGMSPDSIVAVTAGRLVDQKGHRYLLDAAAALVSIYPRLRFLWCGNGPLEQELREKAATRGLSEHIIFAGMLNSVELEIAGADLMVHPSIEEPFGIAVLEGMRAGLPVVASNVGGIPEVVGDTGVLVDAFSPQAIVDGVDGVLKDETRRRALSKAARVRYQDRFSVDSMIGQVEAYFAEIAQLEKRHG